MFASSPDVSVLCTELDVPGDFALISFVGGLGRSLLASQSSTFVFMASLSDPDSFVISCWPTRSSNLQHNMFEECLHVQTKLTDNLSRCQKEKEQHVTYPRREKECKTVGEQFEFRWNFPHCLGAVDGKHVWITLPSESGSYYWNYKGYNSLVLMAVVNANYEFIMADIGTNGRLSDGGVIDNTEFSKRLKDEKLCIPHESVTATSNCVLPYVFMGDEAFALRTDSLKPYSQKDLHSEKRVFNYRLSRARRVAENAFGIMASRFKIFHTCINLKLTSIDKVVMACVVLHNYLQKACPSDYSPEDCFHREDRINYMKAPMKLNKVIYA
ncbi:uncharacterized protein LOC135108618 [Scylla paramamosain]|uniref:uncharacterized protein LOC135108618 n=1 Tax=Scylla paramamosain TaxID=85552 RepID=UPI003082FABB